MFFTPWDAQAYWADTLQRSILFLDVMRQRANQFIEHYEAGKPPVLAFDYDVVMDGATLERPCNYMLLRIKPPADQPTDPKKRPYVVFDPRAGHGPGIGGSKEASQVGVALAAGHPVYFVSFRPHPVAGQTLRDVARAEKQFLDQVIALHPHADAKPAIVGNCQAGWAIMMLSAYAPDQASVISVAGAPLSYWAGVEGKDPLRYFGGLMGGNWSAALLADLGGGLFDGANLVTNFENLNPANTLVGKPYNLYSKVDTEAQRFLDFERWWGGYFLLTRDEIVELTSELFVGNKLAAGKIIASDGTPIDLRDIRAPIVVIASKGDNITPPAQALNWILDLYEDEDELRANEQTIVYTVHDSVGHLGIFVSAKVAVKEHAEFVNSLDLIESLPPGLFEMVVEKVEGEEDCQQFTVHFERRTLDDIRAYDDGREDEKPFRAVAHFSEVAEGLYSTFASPWIRAMSSELSGEALRWMNPKRQRYMAYAELNPMMWGVRAAAELVRANRIEAGPENPFRAAEAAVVKAVETTLQNATTQRDLAIERMFKAIWTNPFLLTLAGETASFADSRKPAASKERAYRHLKDLRLQALEAREAQGSFAQAIMRVLYAAIDETGVVDSRAFAAAREAKLAHPRIRALDHASFLRDAKEAALMVALDKDKALEQLPYLLPEKDDRREAIELLQRIVEWRPNVAPEVRAVLDRVKSILGAKGGSRFQAAPKPKAPETADRRANGEGVSRRTPLN
ncbi:DUF3141 domain-containing protein [Methyloceanibacter sp.]|uniref:DUF3141 domain-containing protein n=1 Tax=Methyloceanibacter sp. TaxID=1965321 RepID=UPI002BB54C73|nr:DUF3141 domain-containing protein [Methyloceanibacter sp.]HML90800.1 DUF3141 domain-containing protein [Methyloceanibacter sp.]